MTARRRLTICVCALAWAAVAPASAEVLEDWSSGDDSAWTRVDLLDEYGLGGTSYEVSGGQYHLTSKVPLPPLDIDMGSASLYTESVADPAKYADGYLTTRFTLNNETTDAFVPMRANVTELDFISFYASQEDDSVGISVFDNFDYINGTSASLDIEPGVEYFLTAGAVGSELSIKVWAVGTEEPAEPQAVLIDSTYTQGQIGVAMFNQHLIGGTLAISYGEVSFVPEAGSLALFAAAGLLLRRRRG